MFKSCTPFYLALEVLGTGWGIFTVCLWYRAYQLVIPIPGSYRMWRLPKRPLLTIKERQ